MSIATIGKVIGVGMNIADPIFTYKGERKEGNGVLKSTVNAGVAFALFSKTLSPLGWGLMAKDLAVAGVKMSGAIGAANGKTQSKAYGASFGGDFQDTSNAATMRQRGVSAIQNNGLNARSVLGSEARQYFRRF